MKIFIILLFILTGGIYGGYLYLMNTPSRIYNGILSNELKTKWFIVDEIDHFDLNGEEKNYTPNETIQNVKLWKSFSFKDLSIPLPVRNPFYLVSPILKYNNANRSTKIGFSILNSKGVQLSEILILPKSQFPNFMSSQDLFELPLVKNVLKEKTTEEIWNDVFLREIRPGEEDWKLMVYNLYILNFRKKFIPKEASAYGPLKNTKKKVISLNYPNKDFFAEMIIEKNGFELESFILVTRKADSLAMQVRDMMINEISAIDTSTNLSDIIMKEFKSLEYVDKIDHTGMIYLLSAWSHDLGRYSILEQAIYFLERGHMNELQLAPLYEYYYDRYQAVFTKKYIPGVKVPNELKLKLKIAIEDAKSKEQILKKSPIKYQEKKQDNIDEQFEDIIEKAKLRKSKTIRID